MTFKQYALMAAYILLFFGGAFQILSLMMPLKPPMRDMQDQYQLSLGASIFPPFFYKYYVFEPKKYDPQKKYPVMLLLHGASRHMKNTNFLISDEFQDFQPTFVLVPIAPPQFNWGNPTGTSMSAMPLALDSLRAMSKKYSIDPKRIYVSGYSMGGYGAFNAVAKHSDIFAAGMPLCAGWNVNNLEQFAKTPIWIFHGARDSVIPASGSRGFYEAAKKANMKNIFYQEIPNYGHNIWDAVYGSPEPWLWLLNQRKQ